MLIALIGKNAMYKIVLSQEAEDNYYISDHNSGRKFVNIKVDKGKIQLVDNENMRVLSAESPNTEQKKNIFLKEYDEYIIQFKDTKELFALCCFPTCDSKLFHLSIKGKNTITIGKSKENDICYNNSFVAKNHASMSVRDKKWFIENLNPKYVTFVNSKLVTKKGTYLNNGDVIFIMGFKIIVLGKTIFINNPQGKVICNGKVFKNCKLNLDELSNFIISEDNLVSKEIFRIPRVTNRIENEEIKIDTPPAKQITDEDPLLLSIGPSIVMSLTMVISLINAISGAIKGTSTFWQTFSSMIMAVSMLAGSILFPILRKKYKNKKAEEYELRRQTKYNEYLQNKRMYIEEKMIETRNILFKNYQSPIECFQMVAEHSIHLLEKKIKDYDFLDIRLGIGDIPSNILVKYPEERFSLEIDELKEPVKRIVEDSKIIKQAPIILSLVENKILSILVKEKKYSDKFLKNILTQLITLQNYDDLKLVFLFDEETSRKYECVKMLPHVWSSKREIRFFANNIDNMNEVLHYLNQVFSDRQENGAINYKLENSYYLIVTDCYEKIKNQSVIKDAFNSSSNFGFSIICVSEDLNCIPSNCKTIVNVGNDEEATIFYDDGNIIRKNIIKLEISNDLDFNRICKSISNMPVNYQESKERLLPNECSFLGMYNVSSVEQLNIPSRWRKNNSTESLKALLGIDEVGAPITLDIHEKFHGPHGLIAGSTGSGKSELIITYILSLAINYHPDDVSFVLIDYKGGGLAGAFQKRKIRLPHLVGTITNIDTHRLQRSLASIESEVRRRQIIFNEAREMTDEGTIDIYKYQRLYHMGKISTPLPHLLIICDEFAELKQQQSDFMDELISISRIGRSLGVHLILATQKPAGIVNEQIRSNSKFAICLKVQDASDSNDVIKKPDAANLKRAGEFYLQVGNDEYFVLGQSGWAGAPYTPTVEINDKEKDNSIKFIDDIGNTIKEVNDTTKKIVKSQGEQLTNIVEYLYNLGQKENIETKNLWLDEISENIFLQDLRQKYDAEIEKNYISPIIGEYDDPYNQKQDLVKIDLSSQGNTIIYGNAESGKETLLSTMIFDIITTHITEEVNLYLLDFGSEALKVFKDSAQVADIIFSKDGEKTFRFFDLLSKELNRRKDLLSDYGGNYRVYLKKSSEPFPALIVILNNYENFVEIYKEKYDEQLLTLTREGTKYGITFVFSLDTPKTMRYRLSQNFVNKIALQLNEDSDYSNIFENARKKRPASIFGRGLVDIEGGTLCEFQTAKVCDADEYYEFIKEKIEEVNKVNKIKAEKIPVLPDKLLFDDLKPYIKDLSSVPVGIARMSLKVITYNFLKNFGNVVVSKETKEAMEFSGYLLKEIAEIKNIDVKVFNANLASQDEIENVIAEYNQFVESIENTKNFTVVAILGLSKFVKEIEKNIGKFKVTLEKLKESKKCIIIFVDNTLKFKEFEFQEWYKKFIPKDYGIWVGNGAESQYTININSVSGRRPINYGRTFGYIAEQEKSNLVKLLEMSEEVNNE